MLKYKMIEMDKRMVEFHFLGRHSKYSKQQHLGQVAIFPRFFPLTIIANHCYYYYCYYWKKKHHLNRECNDIFGPMAIFGAMEMEITYQIKYNRSYLLVIAFI